MTSGRLAEQLQGDAVYSCGDPAQFGEVLSVDKHDGHGGFENAGAGRIEYDK